MLPQEEEEESFPRSSGDVSTKFKKRTTAFHIPEDEQLFKSRKKRSSKPSINDQNNNNNNNKKRKKFIHHSSDLNEESLKKTVVENLSLKRLIENMIVYGCLQEINDFELKFSITGGIIVTVPITNVSTPYTNLLENFANDNLPQMDTKEISKLTTIFNVGDYFPVKILSKQTCDKFGHTEVIGSINPRDVYQNFTMKTFTKLPKGYRLVVAVASQEDHGYLVDVGIDEIKAFLPIQDLKENSHNIDLKIGQLIQCSVNKSYERSLSLTVDRKLSNFVVHDDHKPSIHFYSPGVHTFATIISLHDSGLELNVPGGYQGFVPRYHVNDDLSVSPKQLKIGDKVKGHVLYVHPHTKQVCVSLKTKLNRQKVRQLLDSVKIGLRLPKVTVWGHTHSGTVIFKTPQHGYAIALKKNLSEPKENDGDENDLHGQHVYTLGSSHVARVKNFHLFDNLLELSLRKSFIESEDVSLDDIRVGSVLTGVVKKYRPDGIYLKLGFGINGFIPKIHLMDAPIINYDRIRDRLFPIGQPVQCRVMRIDGGSMVPKITLTAKKTLLNLKENQLFKDFAEIQPGMSSTGVVCLTNGRGILLEFFNRVNGFIPIKYLAAYKIEHPEKVFQIGQLINCTVVSVDGQSQRMTCSLVDVEETKKLKQKLQIKNKNDTMNAKLNVGQMLKKMKIITKIPLKGFDLTNPQEKIQVFLPISHLSDDPFICQLLFSAYQVDDILEEVMVFSKDAANVVCVSRKSVFMKHQNLIMSEQDIIMNSPFPAVVRNVTATGLFFETPNLQYGFVRKKYLQDGFYDEPQQLGLSRGQTLFVNPFDINTIQPSKDFDDNCLRQFQFSTKLSHVLKKNEDLRMDILKTFLDEFDHGKSLLCRSSKDLASYSIGQVVTYLVTEITEDQVKVRVSLSGSKNEPTVIGLAMLEKKSHNLGISQMGNAIVCDIDFQQEQLIVFIQPTPAKLIKQVKNFQRKNLNKLKLNQIVKGTVIHCNEKYVLAIMAGHVPGLVAMVSAKKHYNDLRHVEKLYTIGQCYHFEVRHIENDSSRTRILMVLNESGKKSTTEPINKGGQGLLKNEEHSFNATSAKNTDVVEVMKPADETRLLEEKKQVQSSSKKASVVEKFDWDVVDLSKLNGKRKLNELKPCDDDDDEDDEDDFDLSDDSDDHQAPNKKRKSREERNNEAREREQSLRQKENQLTDMDRTPMDEQDFEMAVVASPNSSLVWIKYMAYYLERKEFSKAREIGERALRKISFREEKERINIWVSLLNLENNFGDENSMKELVDKAIKFNDAKTIYSRLAIIYNDSNKLEKAEQIYQIMIKKFYSDESVWLDYILFHFKNGHIEQARQLFRKSLQNVDKRHHVDLISKFAQLEFRYGDCEQGKTIFENLLATYWKRLDKWSIYIDMLIKYTLNDGAAKDDGHDDDDDDDVKQDNIDSIEFIRNIFQRLLTFKYSPHKMKFIFKKYYDFESRYSAENVEILENIKQKALEYVENGIF